MSEETRTKAYDLVRSLHNYSRPPRAQEIVDAITDHVLDEVQQRVLTPAQAEGMMLVTLPSARGWEQVNIHKGPVLGDLETAKARISALEDALKDCISVMDAELNGLQVIQPELRNAKAALGGNQ